MCGCHVGCHKWTPGFLTIGGKSDTIEHSHMVVYRRSLVDSGGMWNALVGLYMPYCFCSIISTISTTLSTQDELIYSLSNLETAQIVIGNKRSLVAYQMAQMGKIPNKRMLEAFWQAER